MVAERKWLRTTEEEPLLHVTHHCRLQLGVDAELPGIGIAIFKTALGQALKPDRAFAFFRGGAGAYSFLSFQVFLQPGCEDRPGRQAGCAHECDDVFRLGLKQHLLEVDMGITLIGYCERRADLYGAGTLADQLLDLLEGVDATSWDQGNRIKFQLFEDLGDL